MVLEGNQGQRRSTVHTWQEGTGCCEIEVCPKGVFEEDVCTCRSPANQILTTSAFFFLENVNLNTFFFPHQPCTLCFLGLDCFTQEKKSFVVFHYKEREKGERTNERCKMIVLCSVQIEGEGERRRKRQYPRNAKVPNSFSCNFNTILSRLINDSEEISYFVPFSFLYKRSLIS